jgi:hypothetical protein
MFLVWRLSSGRRWSRARECLEKRMDADKYNGAAHRCQSGGRNGRGSVAGAGRETYARGCRAWVGRGVGAARSRLSEVSDDRSGSARCVRGGGRQQPGRQLGRHVHAKDRANEGGARSCSFGLARSPARSPSWRILIASFEGLNLTGCALRFSSVSPRRTRVI